MDAVFCAVAAPQPPASRSPAPAGHDTRPNGDFSRTLESARRAAEPDAQRRAQHEPRRDAERDKVSGQPAQDRAGETARAARDGDGATPTDATATAAQHAAEDRGAAEVQACTAGADRNAEAGADTPPDLAALLPGWPAKPGLPDPTATASEDAQVAGGADPRAGAGRGRAARDAANSPGLAGLDHALGGAAGRTPAAETLDAVRAAHAPVPEVGMPAQARTPPATTGAHAAVLAAAPGVSQLGAPPAPAASAAPHPAHVAAAVDTPAFAPALGTTLSLLARDGVQQAQLSLHPAELGPVAVQIAVDGTQARIDFHAAHATTRAALEASLPELAAALRDSGLTLTGGGVFDQSRQRQADPSSMPAGRGDGDNFAEADAPITTAAPPRPRGVVDLIA